MSLDEIANSIKALAIDLKDVKTTAESNNKSITKLTSKVNLISEEQVKIKDNVAFLLEENQALKIQINQLEQYQKKSNIIIHGIPYEANEAGRQKVRWSDDMVLITTGQLMTGVSG